MADVKISALPVATTPLAGTELVPVVQGGVTKQVAASQLASGGSGTVTSVGMTVPVGLSVSGSPVTTSGTLAVSYAAGYAIPTTAKQTEWDTAYSWGNHASAGYVNAAGAAAAAPVQSVAGKTGAVTLAKGDVGLSNVDNTSDVNKPVSTAQQAAIDAKVSKTGDTMTGPLSVPAGASGAQVPQAQEVVGVTGSTGSAKMPSGTTAQRDGSPGVGYTRFNSTLGTNETWTGSNWVQEGLSGASLVPLSGTAVDITGIPSWAKRVTLNFNGLSTNGTSLKLVQLGTSGGIQTTGYRGSSVVTSGGGGAGISSIEGMVFYSNNPVNAFVGSAVFTRASVASNLWVGTAVVGLAGETFAIFSGMDVTLSAPLDRLRITTANGTDAFDAGNVSISWEA